MRSWQSAAFEKFLWLRGTKKKFMDLSLMDQYIANKYNEVPYKLDEKFQQKHGIVKETIDEMDYYIVNEQAAPKKVVYYFHGGAYMNHPMMFHWRYVVKLAKATNFTVIMPMYPKMPRFTHEVCYEKVHALYDVLVARYDAPFIFMGDSAGGGLALAFAQDVKKLGKKQNEHVVMYSGWFDVTGETPGYEEIEPIDPMLGKVGAVYLGKRWANSVDPKDPRISPYFGDLHAIGQLSSFVGTYELLLVDARMLKEKAAKEGVPLYYEEYEGMNHVFPVFPIPEADEVLKKVVRIIG